MVRIPAEYQEVEYIESKGTQFIDTGLQFGESDFKITSRFAQTKRTAAEQPLISIWSSTYQYWNCFIREANRAVDFYLGGHVVPKSPVLSANEIIDIALERNGSEWMITQPGSTLSKTYNPSMVNDTSMKIFKRGDINGTTYARMYSLTVEMDGELAANFIPCYHKSSGEIGMYDTVSKQFYTNSGTGTFLKGNDVTYDPISLLETRRKMLLNTPHIATASGSIAAFNTDISTNITDMKIHFLPVQEGTGDLSPDNVRPITGWDGVTVTRCGKNLLKPSASLSGVAVRSAGTMVTTDARYNIYIVQVKPNTNYTMKKTGQGYYPTFGLLNKYPELGDVVDGYESLRYRNTYTFNSGDHIYALFSFGVNDFNTIDIQVEEGSTATTYEPYTDPCRRTADYEREPWGFS